MNPWACVAILEAAALVWLYRRHEAIVKDLLDRVMAKNYTDYTVTRLPKPAPRAPRGPLTDEELAALERTRKRDLEAASGR